LDNEYLENYQRREDEEYERLVLKKIEDGTIDYEQDKYPPDNRFINLQRPITDSTAFGCFAEDRWSQIPFSGSTILNLDACPPKEFERFYFKISEIPKVIDFIKETGKIQITLQQNPIFYEGLDYLDPFFKELEPPFFRGINYTAFGSETEIKHCLDSFRTLAGYKFYDFYNQVIERNCKTRNYSKKSMSETFTEYRLMYTVLKLRFPKIALEIEDSMIDNPCKTLLLLNVSSNFILDPIRDLRCDWLTHSFEEIQMGKRMLGNAINPNEIRFPCEIGKFLINKMTVAPTGLRACNEIIDHYKSYDLQKVNSALNKAILENDFDIIENNAKALSELLDNVWSDKGITRRIKGLKIGLPLSIVATGKLIASSVGGLGGLLAGLGFDLGAKIFEAKTDGLNEKIAKRFSGSYLADIYDFRKRYDALMSFNR
jgi:hypothetical protein